MFCPSCKHENRAGQKICVHCGAGLDLSCPSCGASTEPEERFCGECGKNLAGVPKTSATRDPRSYTPKHLAEKILTTRSALEGERKQVTVLFADVKGSMELAEQLDPEEWHRILDRFFQILTDGVHRFEGTVNQYTGDGIMALFGAPIAHEDHVQRACYAALHLRDTLRRYADELRIGKGINSAVTDRPELGRGRGWEDRRRPAHGLHGARANGQPGSADGADRRSRQGAPHWAHGEVRLRLLRAPRPG